MVKLVTAVKHMLEAARHTSATGPRSTAALQQLVLIVADGRFHERDALRRVVAVQDP